MVHLTCHPMTQVSGVHGHAVSSKKYMLVDFAIALYSKGTQPEERITLRQVACCYHPQFPTVLGEPALRAAGLMPDQNVISGTLSAIVYATYSCE